MTLLQMTSSGNLSGGTRQAILLSRGLAAAGHRVLFLGPPGSRCLRTAAEAGLATEGMRFGSLWAQWRASRRLRSLAARIGADVVHAHHTKGHNVALLASLGGGFPPVIANRGVLFRPVLPLKFTTPRTAAVITNSARVKAVLEECGVAGSKVHVIPNAREVSPREALAPRLPELRRELGLEEGWPVIGAVGRARPEKGFQHLVEAAPEILRRYPEAVFVVVGSGTERFEARLAELGVRDRFRLPGHRHDAVDIMGLFDLFVLPSVDMESCPNVLLEAMGAGVPAIGSDVGGVSEILAGGEAGRVVPPGAPWALAAAAVEVLADREGAARLGERGRRRVEEEFSLAAKVTRTERVYAEVLGR